MRLLRLILSLFLVAPMALGAALAPAKAAEGHLYLFLVRHGQSTDNAAGLQSGWSEAPLTPLGVRQAKIMATKLGGQQFLAAYSSGSVRASQTLAELLRPRSDALAAKADPRFREWGVGMFDQKPVAVVEQAEAKVLKTEPKSLWKFTDAARFDALAASDSTHKTENWSKFKTRILAGANALKAKYQSGAVLVVTHGYVVKHLVKQLTGKWPTGSISNTSVTVLDYSAGKWSLLQGPTLAPTPLN